MQERVHGGDGVVRTAAAIVRDPGSSFEIVEVELDAPRADEILVRIHGVGICHTDVAVRDQHIPVPLPAILGHEGAGVVEVVGANVSKVKPGDHVVLTFLSCGDCDQCGRGEPAYCVRMGPLNTCGHRTDGSPTARLNGMPLSANFFGQSSFARFALAKECNVVLVPDDLPLAILGPLGCGVQTGAGSVMRSLACRRGSSILVLGGGAVGLSAVLGAVVQGCATIVVSEPCVSRRALALEIGATHVLDPGDGDLASAVRRISEAGMDYALDTTGRADVVSAALASLAKRGMLGLVGVPADPAAAVPMRLAAMLGTAITVRGIVEGDSDPDTFIPELLDLYRRGKLPFDKLVRCYGFDQINQAVRDQLSGETVKAVLLTDAAASGSAGAPLLLNGEQ